MITKIAGPKLDRILALLATVRSLDGAIAELGVYQGGGVKAMAEACPEKYAYGFDTFTGMPEASWQKGEGHSPGDFGSTNLEMVRREMPPNVVLVPGYFPDSVREFNSQLRFCFVHLDMDFYKSTRDAIAWLRPRMTPGGYIVFDDYVKVGCEGVTRAISEAKLDVIAMSKHQCYWKAHG